MYIYNEKYFFTIETSRIAFECELQFLKKC